MRIDILAQNYTKQEFDNNNKKFIEETEIWILRDTDSFLCVKKQIISSSVFKSFVFTNYMLL